MRCPLAVALGALALVTGVVTALPSAVDATVTITPAVVQPGTPALHDATQASQTSFVDCAAPGECVAVGNFGSANRTRAWGAVMTGGVWADAVELPGVDALNSFESGAVELRDLSCPAAGECLAGGTVRSSGSLSGYDPFAIAMTGGVWQTAVLLEGTVTGAAAFVTDIDCAAVGECAVVGTADDRAFTADLVAGVLGDTVAVPGLDPGVESNNPFVSCPTTDECVLVGYYGSYGNRKLFSSTRTSGTWGSATDINDSANYDEQGIILPFAFACAGAGECVLSGLGQAAAGTRTILATMTGGVWGDVTLLPVSAQFADSPYSGPFSIACPASGECVLTGFSYDPSWNLSLYVATQAGGVWGEATEAPGVLNNPTNNSESLYFSLSCADVGECVAVGTMEPGTPDRTPFLTVISGGEVLPAQEIPGIDALQTGASGGALTVSCTSDGSCVGGGQFLTSGDPWGESFTFSLTGLEPAQTTTTTTESTTTTSTEPTTTLAPQPSSTVPGTTDPGATDHGGTSASPSPVASRATGTLPTTGASVAPLLAAATLLVTAGGAASVLAVRRRRAEAVD